MTGVEVVLGNAGVPERDAISTASCSALRHGDLGTAGIAVGVVRELAARGRLVRHGFGERAVEALTDQVLDELGLAGLPPSSFGFLAVIPSTTQSSVRRAPPPARSSAVVRDGAG